MNEMGSCEEEGWFHKFDRYSFYLICILMVIVIITMALREYVWT